ncbi:MAG TPA: ferritin-like domain-containing protein [Solirubrobacterales bacterium]|nr:ferritin-like domain-containing protein [Solirubrobacterales bacterium]
MTDNTKAAPELENVQFEAIDRSSFLMKGVLAAGATYGAFAAGPMLRRAFAQDGGSEGDIEILNFALTLEYLETAFYEAAVKEADLSSEVAALAKQFGEQEAEHVDGLTKAIEDLGGKPVEAPAVDFGDAFASEDSFLQTGITFEDLGVSAYNGAGPMISSKELLATAGAIVQIEGRHAAAVRNAAGEPAAPDAFDPTMTVEEVTKAVQPFLAK